MKECLRALLMTNPLYHLTWGAELLSAGSQGKQGKELVASAAWRSLLVGATYWCQITLQDFASTWAACVALSSA